MFCELRRCEGRYSTVGELRAISSQLDLPGEVFVGWLSSGEGRSCTEYVIDCKGGYVHGGYWSSGLIFMLRRIETASLLCQMRVLLVMDFACLCIQSLFLFFKINIS